MLFRWLFRTCKARLLYPYIKSTILEYTANNSAPTVCKIMNDLVGNRIVINETKQMNIEKFYYDLSDRKKYPYSTKTLALFSFFNRNNSYCC